MLNITLEKDFVTKAGSQLELFSWNDSKTAACRCCYCGDSQKKKNKRRGYFYQYTDKNGNVSYRYKCHNCGVHLSLYDFLDEQFPELHREMKFEFIRSKKIEEEYKTHTPNKQSLIENHPPKTVPYMVDVLQEYPTIFDLDSTHRARVYMEQERKLPKKSLMRLYYVEDFAHLVSQIDPEKELETHEPRIIFPMYTGDKQLFGVSGRCIGSDSNLRYITIKRQDTRHIKVYGLDRFDPDKEGFCVEGALDSEFLPNCISMAGLGQIKKDSIPFNIDNMTMVFDNEPRNKDVVRYMKTALNSGFKVCVWGKDYPFKDVNEGVQNGWSQERILDHIRKNSYKGLMGLTKMVEW